MKSLGMLLVLIFTSLSWAQQQQYFMEIRANDKFERTQLAELGLAIEKVNSDHVLAIGQANDLDLLNDQNKLIKAWPLSHSTLDFPDRDEKFHNYRELISELEKLAEKAPGLVHLENIGQTHEGLEIIVVKISENVFNSSDKPAALFLGGHHAREHLSIEVPLMLAKHLVNGYLNGDPRITNLLTWRNVYIVPMVNPDGAEFDIATGSYKYWRKNRRQNSKSSFGVDLNRNYDFQWGTTGSSPDPKSNTYRGSKPFSEPESRAIKNFIESHNNISILLSFHSFSELILYPWGHKYSPIETQRDLQVHQTMAETMAQWNGYTPQQSSDLYAASGDTTDWSYGRHGIISFTFELDPSSMWDGGFYPGQSYIERVFNKNIEPCLYLIDYADNPYRSIEPLHKTYGLNSPLLQ